MLEYLEDLESDFLLIGHVDPLSLDSATFFTLAARMSAYDGAVTARILKLREADRVAAKTQPLAALAMSDNDLFEMG